MGKFAKAEIENIEEIRISIVVSRFNEKITSALLDGALNELDKNSVSRDKVDVFYVPGSLELAVVAKACAANGADAVICLGAVIRGDTAHFEYVSNTTALAISDVALTTGVPCIFGVLTVDSEQQAQERIGGSEGHKGEEAAASALETIATLKKVVDAPSASKKKSTGFIGS